MCTCLEARRATCWLGLSLVSHSDSCDQLLGEACAFMPSDSLERHNKSKFTDTACQTTREASRRVVWCALQTCTSTPFDKFIHIYRILCIFTRAREQKICVMDSKHGSRLFSGFLANAGRVFYFNGNAVNNGLCKRFRFRSLAQNRN